MEAKGNIRKEVFARRRAATQEEIQEKSRMIYEKITALPEFLDADCFFAYMDFKKEVMTRDLIEKALQRGKTLRKPGQRSILTKLCEAVVTAGEQLKAYFPYQADDVNELPDEISFQ